jgi:DinB superfamily
MSIPQAGVHCRQLAACRAMFQENRRVADRLAGGLTTQQFNWRPAPDRWSVAQCLVHLNISAELYVPPMQSAIRAGRSQGLLGFGPFRYGLLSRWMLQAVDPANRRKHKSPALFVASAAMTYSVGEVLSDFQAAGGRWEQLVREADGLDLARITVRSPAVSLIRLPIGAWFDIQATHERRHLRQAEDVLRLQAQ